MVTSAWIFRDYCIISTWNSQILVHIVPWCPANSWVSESGPSLSLFYHCSDFPSPDFLPVKCDACESIFCKDHFSYANHDCAKAYLKDHQVPVCPLCNEPVPTKRGQLPDISVSQHIDNECQDDRAKKKRKSANRCSLKGCKNKELIPVLCSDCKLNFCLRHRHPSDHMCNPREARIPVHLRNSGASGPSSSSTRNNSSSSNRIPKLLTGIVAGSFKCKSNKQDLSLLNNHMSEDEALAHAIAASLNPPSSSFIGNKDTLSAQEQEDRMLAEAIVASERESQPANNRSSHEQRCALS